MSESLQEIQEQFAASLLNAEFDSILPALKSNPLTKSDRFSIYRGNLLAIWNKTLANAYPVVQRLVGEDFFEDIARAYGRQYPSHSGDLNFFGEHFPPFLKVQESLLAYPYIVAVAELEWLLHRSYYARKELQISLPQLISQAGDNIQQVRLSFAPDVSFHQSEFATLAIWQAHQAAEVEDLTTPIHTPTFGVISRPGWQAQVTGLGEASYCALEALYEGQTLESALDLALQIEVDFDVGAQLQVWFAAGFFVGHSCKE